MNINDITDRVIAALKPTWWGRALLIVLWVLCVVAMIPAVPICIVWVLCTTPIQVALWVFTGNDKWIDWW